MKHKYDKEVGALKGKTKYDYRRKKHVPMKATQSFCGKSFLYRATKSLLNDFAEGEQPLLKVS